MGAGEAFIILMRTNTLWVYQMLKPLRLHTLARPNVIINI